MKAQNRMITSFILIMLLLAPSVHAADCCTYVTDTGGCAYDECRAATNVGAAIALGTIAVVAIIALGIQNSHHTTTTTHAH